MWDLVVQEAGVLPKVVNTTRSGILLTAIDYSHPD